MHKIVTDIDNLYMQNPRYDMNITLTALIVDSLVSNVLAPERMVLEHMLLIAALHANVGSEVGKFVIIYVNRFAKVRILQHKVDPNIYLILWPSSQPNLYSRELYSEKLFEGAMIVLMLFQYL